MLIELQTPQTILQNDTFLVIKNLKQFSQLLFSKFKKSKQLKV